MPPLGKSLLIATAGIAGFSLLLLIISVATTTWLDNGNGSTIGLFRKCYGDNTANLGLSNGPGCYNENRVTQAGLSIFGLLLLVFSIVAVIASVFIPNPIILFGGLGLLYFSSMFVMAAYATWGNYTRDTATYFFPYSPTINIPNTSVGPSYNLCVAAHYFIWTALTVLAFATGYLYSAERNQP
ncbi:unnamed protein product [Adineta ricciae]|uniref:Uncharacterized protein n=1 Tax=Adineta ricciae TaxID=249248 RepID=A0A813MZE9_ADIRI|nr:unnamed protein product [Adineta ricciae]CAF1111232.1 unnamed protein product [Adineta ricciae]